MYIGNNDEFSYKCLKCGRELTKDDIGIYRKMINRGATRYFCITCLAKELNMTEEELKSKVDQFRDQGCVLFL